MIRGHLFMSAAKRAGRKNGQFIKEEEKEEKEEKEEEEREEKEEEEREREDI